MPPPLPPHLAPFPSFPALHYASSSPSVFSSATLPKKVHTGGGSVPEKGGGDCAPVVVGCSCREDKGEDLLVSCYYIECDMNEFVILPAQLYSNTPSDFDFKLESLAQEFGSLSEFAEHLAANVDIVFPVIHGKFCEGDGIQMP
ncbi:uncharacterized protein LOC125521401 isoform X2 [Triticum urartu]|uniref:uncharacterized protein LOC125521401 isoform X2 n=1 Tax=Triticum urartu TaxID=4572 RepID=UPI0020442F1C|nr:uncharacterized protein LOC125521401 isoform X2 [Triticum urartu]